MILPKLHPQETRWYQSTEYLAVIATLASFFYAALCGGVRGGLTLHVEMTLFLMVICGVAAAYQWGRTLWKKNRGHMYTGFITSEFQMWMIEFAVAWRLYYRYDLSAKFFFLALLWAAANYCVSRGITKGIGVKTQMVMIR